MARLSEMAYWVGLGNDVAHYCTCCFKCQVTKAPEQTPAPLQPVIATKPWELVAVDVLKVPMSAEGNQFFLSKLFFQVAFCQSNAQSKSREK